MADTRDKVGRAGVFLAGGVFKTAVYIFIIVFLIWVGKSAYQFGYDVFNQQAMSPGEGQQVTVVIKEGASAYKVGKTLEQKGLVKDALAFTIQERMSAYHGQIKAGTYLLVQPIHRPGSWQCCQEKRARKDRTASDRRRTHADLYQFTGYGEYSISAGVGDKGTCRPGADHPERYAELYEDASGTETTEAHFGGGDCRRLLHTSYV